MITLLFNTKYKKISGITDFDKCIGYYDRDDRADKNQLSMMKDDEANDMFSYYFYRKGSSGCFDFQGDKSYEDIMEEYQNHKPTYIWQSVISFTKEDAADFGLKDKRDFAALTRKVVVKMAQEKNIPLKDVAWGGFYHVNTDHPHVHFYFYDKRNPIDNTLFSSRSISRIRAAIAREAVDRSLLLKGKEDASRQVLLHMREIINDDKLLKELQSYRTLRTIEVQRYVNPKFHLTKEFFDQFQKLNEMLPTTGRLSYNAHALEPYLNEIDHMIEIMLKQKGLADDYRTYSNMLKEVYHSNEELYGSGERQLQYLDDQKKRLYASLGNSILKMLKVYRQSVSEQPIMRFSRFLAAKDIRRETKKLVRCHGYDLMRFSFYSMKHELSQLRQMQRIRERNQRMMIRETEKEREEREYEEEHRNT